jgi:eukaryotic-like serine/threonine-protein kinase
MTPERWQKVKAIFDVAVRFDAYQRKAYLNEACGNDEALRREVESLLATHERDGSFMDSPTYNPPQGQLTPGQTVGSYTIKSFIGQGGMGDVYLAFDTRLKRPVALKLLPQAVTSNSERVRRFEQEARAASALNHPNIITVYEICEIDSSLMIATEFVDGETLRLRLTSGRLEIREALDIAIQIADALAAAHKAGVVHRDVKPENIMIRSDGYVKVLDFSLAKLTERNAPEPSAEAPTQVRTGSGVIVGTIGYMSPEQARGKSVDVRSDIFNLGTVIYEMVAGKCPFTGETPSDVFASILKTEPPPLSTVVPEAPAELSRIVDKALRKDREERYQVVKDLLLDLKVLKEDLDFRAKLGRVESSIDASRGTTFNQTAPTTENRVTPTRPDKTNIVTIVFAVLLAVAGVAGLYLFLKRGQNAVGPLRPTQITSWAGFDCYPSLSPDGNSVVYASDRNGDFELYVKQLTAGGREMQLTSDGFENLQPTWSPDGKWIAYSSRLRGGVWVIPAFGGNPRQLTDSGSYPAWSPDGSQIAYQTAGIGEDLAAIGSGALLPSTIWIIPALGGEAKQLTHVGTPDGGHGSPAWAPDGLHIAFGSYDPEKIEVWTVGVLGGSPTKITRGYDPVYSPDGKWLFFASFGQNLNFGVSKIPVSRDGSPAGEAVELAATGTGPYKRLTISADGKRLAFGSVGVNSNILSLPMSKTGATGPSFSLTRDTSFRNSAPSFSPDGSRIAYHVTRVGTQPDIYLMNADGSSPTQVTTNPEKDERPSWFPDGQRIVFLSRRQNKDEVWLHDFNSGREQKLIDVGQDITFPQLSPDGRQLVFNSKKNGTTNLWLVPIGGGEPRPLTFDKESLGFACWSPDSQFLAVELKRGDNSFLALMPANGGEVVQLNSGQGQSWPYSFSTDGDKIVFAGSRAGVWNVWWYSRSTKEEKQLSNHTKLNAFVRYPSWSPLGNQIVYEYAETIGNIWMIELR